MNSKKDLLKYTYSDQSHRKRDKLAASIKDANASAKKAAATQSKAPMSITTIKHAGSGETSIITHIPPPKPANLRYNNTDMVTVVSTAYNDNETETLGNDKGQNCDLGHLDQIYVNKWQQLTDKKAFFPSDSIST